MESFEVYALRMLITSGNIPVVILILVILGLTTVVISLWRANLELTKNILVLHRELVEQTEDYAEKSVSQTREITTAITGLMLVVSNQVDERDCKDEE